MKLIDKDALVAEIKERIETYNKGYANGDDRRADALEELLHDIDTLEVKEVDLEKEIKEVQRNYKTIEEYEGYPCTMYADGIEWIAKHFFELGLKAKEGK